MAEQPVRLVVNFDINKTLIISDAAGGKDTRETINGLLAEYAWGHVADARQAAIRAGVADGGGGGEGGGEGGGGAMSTAEMCRLGGLGAPDAEGNVWVLDSLDPSLTPPPADVVAAARPGVPGAAATSYQQYVEALRKRKVLEKKAQKRLSWTFTERGQPGYQMRPHFDRLMAALELPAPLKPLAAALSPVFKTGQAFVLPAFYELLLWLRREGRLATTRVVLRTFGTDIADVARDLDCFCAGQHPLFPGIAKMDGSPGSDADMRLKVSAGCGCFQRHGDGTGADAGAGTHLTLTNAQGTLSVVDGFADIYDCILGKLQSGHQTREFAVEGGHGVLGLQDYYPYWRKHHERAEAGKLLLVDDGALAGDAEPVHQIFFDDNVELERAHIVDVRDVVTGAPIPFAEANGCYIAKADSLRAIVDRNYYIDLVKACEAGFAARRAVKRGNTGREYDCAAAQGIQAAAAPPVAPP